MALGGTKGAGVYLGMPRESVRRDGGVPRGPEDDLGIFVAIFLGGIS
jgi:hypothetical protein